MLLLEVEQGSPEWLAARRGIPTASCFDKIVTTKGEPSKSRTKYLYQLAGERITGGTDDSFRSKFMQRGNDVEAEARAFYELIYDRTVQRVGICYKDESKRIACSPDGLVGKKGGVQIKCPSMAEHIGYLLSSQLPTEYFVQVQGELYVTDRDWWDFISYYPGLRGFVVRVKRDEKFINSLSHELNVFCNDLDKLTEQIR